MRALKIAGAAVGAILVVLVLFLVIGIPSGFLTSEIQARVERESGYRLTISGATKIGLWPSLNVSMSDLTLEAPKDHDGRTRMTVGRVQADITLKSLWAGKPQITELEIVRPVLYRPLLRERESQAAPASISTKATGNSEAPMIDRVKITDGSMVLSDVHDRVENRIDGINVDIRLGGDHNVKVTGSARASNQPLKFEVKATLPPAPLERQNIPVQLAFEAPGALQAPLSAKAEVRLNGDVIMINGLTGTLGDGAFNGWASVDVASKPLVKVDLDFQRLDVAAAKTQATSRDAQGTQPWSDATIDLNGLNYVDAQVRISAAELDIGEARLGPASIDARLASGVLRASFPNLRAYDGLISGQVAIDASTGNSSYALAIDLAGVRALPLLQGVADFDKLDGKMQAKISARSSGNSQRAIMANLTATVFVNFQDGAIKGLNIAQMIRSLTASTLSGWQEGRDQNTDLSQLSASFRIDKGQATSNDLTLIGPLFKITGAGTIDLPAQTLAFRVEPKLVMTTEGQGRASDPVGFGIPVVIDGPWAAPRIYLDMAGILDNPDAAYGQLKQMGKGLFGPNSGGLGTALGGLFGGAAAPGGTGPAAGNAPGGGQPDQLGKLGETLGNLFQGFSQGQGQSQGQNQGQNQGQSQGRSVSEQPSPAPAAPPAAAPPPAASNAPPPPPHDSPAMNDVLRQLFNR